MNVLHNFNNDFEISMSKGMLIRGRFEHGLSELMEKINASIGFDNKMARQDIQCSITHVGMLERQEIISHGVAEKIRVGLTQVAKELEAGTFPFSTALEDIHMNVESRLKEIIGPEAGYLQTARSRNDQVATDFRLWVRDAHDVVIGLLGELIGALVAKADQYAGALMPGYTHMQAAQPVTFGHHLLAYAEMFSRDYSRFADSRKRLNESPLGAAALAGTSFPIDREWAAQQLHFDSPMRNSLDAVSDRDFAVEYLAAATLCMTHLSRLSEEIVLWMCPQFGFVTLSDQWTTGSSIMPQKRNPDAAELIRGKTGRVMGAHTGLVTVMKGLSLTFSKDMQEDKEGMFDGAETLELCVAAMTGMLTDLRANEEAMSAAASKGYSTATDLADWLVRVLELPFREAHHITGQIVQCAERDGVELDRLPLTTLQSVDSRITSAVYEVLSVESSVNSRTSFGGTAPTEVRKQVVYWKARLANLANTN